MKPTHKLSITFILAFMPLAPAPGAAATNELALQAFHQFPSTPRFPYHGLIQASEGNLYGTALETGPDNPGTIYQLTTNGVLTTVYSFPTTNGTGAGARGVLVQGSDGNFYGAIQPAFRVTEALFSGWCSRPCSAFLLTRIEASC